MPTLINILEDYDQQGSIILLEGKRVVLPEDQPLLITLGELLCREMKHARFRSGNAPGSDELFTRGVANIDPNRIEVIVPYTGHRRQSSVAYHIHSLDDISLAAEPEVTYHTSSDSRTTRLVDEFTNGVSNSVTIKAAYLLRDTIKVIGTRSGIPPANFAIFYDDLRNPGKGGTGHTMRVCKNNNIPFITQEVWKNWL
ncbi:MAG: hypothetical protein IH598_06935 [Bacteroidales bacterium]|nr:hypothetical protein [Bacteroidales bacterium]